MAKETTNKKMQLINAYDVNDAMAIDSSKKRRSFVMKYWFDEVVYLNEKKERFKFLSKGSLLRNQCEEILKSHDFDYKNVRFEESLVYVLLVSKDSQKWGS